MRYLGNKLESKQVRLGERLGFKNTLVSPGLLQSKVV